MKTICSRTNSIRITFALLCAWMLAQSQVHGQGTVWFNNRITGTLVTHVYGPNLDFWMPHSGNTSSDTPAGTAVYTGALLAGSGWTAQLWSAPGTTANQADLVASFGSSTFRTGTAAGSWAPTTATLANVAADASAAVLQVRVFPTSYGTWANAFAAYQSGDFNAQVGYSQMFVVHDIGGQVNTPPILTGLTSFSIWIIPEPTTTSLASLATLCLLSARRRSAQD